MKKPVNKFAVALWVLAALVLAAQIGQVISMAGSMQEISGAGGAFLRGFKQSLWLALIGSLSTPAKLAGLGVIIETLDQIRWNTQSKGSR